MTNNVIVERLTTTLEASYALPSEHFDIRSFKTKDTICLACWAAETLPSFNAAGFAMLGNIPRYKGASPACYYKLSLGKDAITRFFHLNYADYIDVFWSKVDVQLSEVQRNIERLIVKYNSPLYPHFKD